MAKRRIPSPKPKAPSAKPIFRSAGIWLLSLGVVVAAVSEVWWLKTEKKGASILGAGAGLSIESDQSVFAQYGGSPSCRDCHEEAFDAWEKSHHAFAERPVKADLDRRAFDPPRTFHHGTQDSASRWTNDTAIVTALGLSGKPEDCNVARVIGHDPLRQFLVPAAGGRFQTLEATYDPRSNQWFNVYGDEDRRPGEWGHWTGRGMNWNFMCAGCHNTRLRRNYDEMTDSYHTTMAEMSVGCESCHGPLKAHNEWQRQYGKSQPGKDPTIKKMPRTQILDTCGFCHARRGDLTGDFKPGDSFSDHFDLTVVDTSERYYADGQIREEDYEYGSFVGSKMHQRGVICTDCHDPHTAKTKLPGNWLCLRCHNGSETNAPLINPVTHSKHKVFGYDTNGVLVNSDLTNYKTKEIVETGGECVNCHMPQTPYMQRHWRHDHGFTIPDPLLTKNHNIPNACNRCHQDKTTDWALEACNKWYGTKMNRPTRTRAEWIARAQEGDPAAREGLLAVLKNEPAPYWRTTILGLLGPWATQPDIATVLMESLDNTSALVRSTAARVIEPALSIPGVNEAVHRCLDDPSRSVRLAAAWSLRATLDTNSIVARELEQMMDRSSDQPGGQMRKGDFFAARHDPQTALLHYQKAVLWDPYSTPFRYRVAVTLFQLNRPREAIETLQEACRINPKDGEAHYQLGLAWNETGDIQRARQELEAAVQANPRLAPAWYNLGLAQNALGESTAAIGSLQRGESADPHDARIPYARATIHARLGERNAAIVAAHKALEIDPNYSEARQFVQELEK